MTHWDDLVAAARTTAIPVPGLRTVTLAHWGVDSDFGESELARRHNNFAGLQWRPEMLGFADRVAFGDDGAEFCKFASPAAFIKGYWAFIGRPVYAGWLAHSAEPADFIDFLKRRGFRSSADWPARVAAAMSKAEEMLDQEPDRPNPSELPFGMDDLIGDEPDFVTIGQVSHAFLGRRPNGLEGAIVHFDAGRTRSANNPADLEFGARNVLAGAQRDGFAFATISRSGKVYLPGNMDWRRWGSHAGASKCPATGRTGVSRFYVGFELNSPGLVYPTADEDVFVPWFDARRGTNGAVILDNRGRATVAKPNGELYKRSTVRVVKSKSENIAAGAYVPFTNAQFDALVKTMLWLRRNFPATFRLDRVFGHDEVSPARKCDPGGSLGRLSDAGAVGDPMPMTKFRSALVAAHAAEQQH